MSPDLEVARDSHPAADADAGHRDTTRRAIVNGIAAAVLGGGAWALIVALADLEVGYVAWGVGGLIGYTMTKATDRRGPGIALIAAGLAAAGLLFGKILIVQRVVAPALAEELGSDSLGAARAAAWELRDAGAFPSPVQAQLDAMGPSDTLSDALWEEMVTAGAAHVANLPAAERDSFAAAYASVVQSNVGLMQMLMWQFSGWDLLWFGLALSTAWGMLKKPLEQTPVAADPDVTTGA
jgi:hypothetical protein